jgi:hypothetical protein
MWENVGKCGKMWENVGKCEKMWENVEKCWKCEKCGKMWKNMGKCGKMWKMYYLFFTKQAILMWRSTVPTLFLQLGFPGVPIMAKIRQKII